MVFVKEGEVVSSDTMIATRKRGIVRALRKLILLFACRTALIPSKGVRPWLCRLGGINIAHPSTVFIGNDVRFDDIAPDRITIGDDVRITTGVKILTHFLDTDFVPSSGKPFQFTTGDVKIGNGVFIGVNSVICKPVTIGDCAIVGAASVITADVPENAVVAGVPAKVLRIRNINAS